MADDWAAAFKAKGWDPGVGGAGTTGGSRFTIPPPATSGAAASGNEVEAYIRSAATSRGIDPDTAIRVAQSEGGLVPNRTGSFSTGKSFWPFQLHYGGQGYEQFGNVAGMGNAFTAKTGWQPGDPNAWQAATDYALDQAKQSGWGQWYGARNVGISGFQGIDRNAPSGGAPSSPTPARPVPDGGRAASDGDGGDWAQAFRALGWVPGGTEGRPDAGGGTVAGPTAGPGNRAGTGSAAGAAFPVAGYTGNVEFHHGASDAVGGSDLFAPEGTPVVSMVPGVVQWASTNDSLGGNNVGIVGDDGLTYYYAHFKNAPRVKQGQRVGAGEQIGDVGRTGNAASTPAHLHIGIGHGIQTGAGAQGGLGQGFNAVDYLRRTLTGAAPAAPGAPAVGRLTSDVPTDDDWVQVFRARGWQPG